MSDEEGNIRNCGKLVCLSPNCHAAGVNGSGMIDGCGCPSPSSSSTLTERRAMGMRSDAPVLEPAGSEPQQTSAVKELSRLGQVCRARHQ